jgi:DNA-binding beta-propeller fold protein YncE
VLHRPRSNTADELGAAQEPPRSECCFPAPPVLKFDPEGNVLASWGGDGEGYNWPAVEHGIWSDNAGNIWIGGNAPTDRHILKFTPSGQFLLQIGQPSSDPLDSSRTDILGQVASLTVDDAANEVYLADGYGNKRVAVYDASNGQFKRLWGAYGNPPNDANPGPYDPAAPIAQQFRNPVHCVRLSNDGFVYVCDRVNNRIQVFTKAGEFVKEFFVRPETRGNGSVWDLSFSTDSAQKYIVVIDGENNVIWTLNRNTGEVVDKQASRGRNAGQFHWVHQFDTDSQGNIYTGEVDTSKRLQKFVLQRN